METQYDSFFVRVWRLTESDTRVEVEHIQSEARADLNSLLAAIVWLASHCGESRPAPEPLFQPTTEQSLDLETGVGKGCQAPGARPGDSLPVAND